VALSQPVTYIFDMVAKVLGSLFLVAMVFFFGSMTTYAIITRVYGVEPYEGSAPFKIGVLMWTLLGGLVFVAIGVVLVCVLLRISNRLNTESSK
jgi:glucan phosphoethanolaminetransferase (alkaline phosphatase superfamily)